MAFAVSNAVKGEMSAHTGIEFTYYNSMGQFLTSFVGLLVMCAHNYKTHRVFWQDQNLIVNGSLIVRNCFGFIMYLLIDVLSLFSMLYTIHFSLEANINPFTTIAFWCLTPILVALLEKLIFAQGPEVIQVVGIIFICICVLLLSIRDMVLTSKTATLFWKMPDLQELKNKDFDATSVVMVEGVPAIVPIVFAILTPIAFSCQASMMKHLVQERVGFDVCVLSFTSQFVISLVILGFGISHWTDKESIIVLDVKYGLLSGFCECIGNAMILYAITNGQGGPACAIYSLQGVFLDIFEITVMKRPLGVVEIIAAIFCIIGLALVVLPKKLF